MAIYTNAMDVLPPDLLAAVRRHWCGLLYIPPEHNRVSKVASVLKMIKSGHTAASIAAVAGITPRRVRQIARRLGNSNPYLRREMTENVTEE